MGRDSNFRFVDQYNAEFNRGIQPMKGGYADNYYMQMAQNIRRFKGVRPIPQIDGYGDIDIDGSFSDWQSIDVVFRDTIGDVVHRDYPGYRGLHYTDTTGRNDIVASQIGVDELNVYFRATTRMPLTPHTDRNWMLLLIDADRNHQTGWHGYDYLVNQDVLDEGQTSLMKFDSASRKWVQFAKVPFAVTGSNLELAILRQDLGLENKSSFEFDFHWADNPVDLKTPISLCTSGDSAPNRRFNYRCRWHH